MEYTGTLLTGSHPFQNMPARADHGDEQLKYPPLTHLDNFFLCLMDEDSEDILWILVTRISCAFLFQNGIILLLLFFLLCLGISYLSHSHLILVSANVTQVWEVTSHRLCCIGPSALPNIPLLPPRNLPLPPAAHPHILGSIWPCQAST